MSEIKESLEALKKITFDLSEAIKKNSEDKSKILSIVEDLKKKQEEFETKAKERKGVFSDDEIDKKELSNIPLNTKTLNSLIESNVKGDEKLSYIREKNDDILIVSQILDIDPRETRIYKKFVEEPIMKKALYTSGSGVGSEWIPTGYSSELYDKIRLELKVGSLHNYIDMPSNPYVFPVVASDSVGYLVAERTGDDDTLNTSYRIPASNVGTTNATLTAKKIAGRVVFSEEISEDSIVPILPIIKANIVTAISSAIENAIINGDTAGTHMDADTTSSTDVRKAWDGYRKVAHSSAKVSLATFTGDNLMLVRKAMGKYGINPANLAIVAGISDFAQMLNLKDSQNNPLVTTVDKYGNFATIITGELGKVYGIPIIVSEFIREDLNASGVYDGITTTKTILVMVFKSGFVLGNKRGLTVKTAEDIVTDQTVLVATQRIAFSSIYNGSTDNIVGIGYNITA